LSVLKPFEVISHGFFSSLSLVFVSSPVSIETEEHERVEESLKIIFEVQYMPRPETEFKPFCEECAQGWIPLKLEVFSSTKAHGSR